MSRDKIRSLYCDGGVIRKNPSSIGGTWAYCLTNNYGIEKFDSGVITPEQMGTEVVTNNQTELYAMVMGLLVLPKYFCGKVYSDSMVTLGRVFHHYSLSNIPDWMIQGYYDAVRRLEHWQEIEGVLVAGHPTKAQLEAGQGKHGLPVSSWNVWCDQECQKQAGQYLHKLEKEKKNESQVHVAQFI